MTLRRLLLTTAAMVAAALGLAAVTPGPGLAVETVLGAPQVGTPSAAEDLVLAVTGLVAWLAWGWGALGLALTAASGLPGAWGVVARLISRVVVPAGLRSAAGFALGVGLVVGTPAAYAAGPPAEPPVPVAVPDWPSSRARCTSSSPVTASGTSPRTGWVTPVPTRPSRAPSPRGGAPTPR